MCLFLGLELEKGIIWSGGDVCDVCALNVNGKDSIGGEGDDTQRGVGFFLCNKHNSDKVGGEARSVFIYRFRVGEGHNMVGGRCMRRGRSKRERKRLDSCGVGRQRMWCGVFFFEHITQLERRSGGDKTIVYFLD